ncbi:hypothetical protein H6G80_30125 [Nostoc sp. FACHB-87]|uniref:hypothetical protein n=1 Tax=Nostocales TaxID=1161 RepID=UPI001683B72C|nr:MULTISPECIES: hypothetical protein [Nostocales]MBD2303266.1 hypothetical protein [Nostoc sp. FACHB-190]MBD2458312.1 hypothetical protein [Nostoc sp. FACHB-87]MBD2479460.1 hypothetical protein [Anabaena sp. FACHB-83]MBD2491245.1 hypothetical protein [Aulosira sp. FACHB-615]
MRTKYLLMTTIMLSTMFLSACQSPEEKAAAARQKQLEAAKAEEEKQIKSLVDSTPDLYRVFWKVCGDGKVNLKRSINNGCDEARYPTLEGYNEPLYMWGTVGDVRVEEVPNPILHSRSWIDFSVFIKSRGCLTSGTPKNEQLYLVREFSVKPNNPVTSSNIRVEKLSKEEKESKIREQAGNVALLRPYTDYGLLPGIDCPSYDEWKKTKPS